ncbi:sterol O-acyltransferase 1 isoform X2 [Carassius auratus]|uniref:O-acyltransferase n=1 Tax=Carassius auratus TaxID=7957 RepID=A0A6P6N971_CARAU|nr:sterol O-acyltransferase 1-like isoform X2 [Carassius auratus]
MVNEGAGGPRSRKGSHKAVPSSDQDGTGAERATGGEVPCPSNGTVEVEHIISAKLQLKKKAEHLKADLMRQFDTQVNEFMDSLIEESASLGSSHVSTVFPLSEKEKNKLRLTQPPQVQSKQFVIRRSLLDDLFEVNHIRTIYHMFIALLILFIFSTLVVDFIDEGRLVLEFDLLVYAFGQFPLVVVTWMCMFLSTLVVPYVLLSFWASVYPTSNHRGLWTVLAGSLLLLYQGLCLGFLPTYVVLKNGLPPASCFILILEQLLLLVLFETGATDNEGSLFHQGKCAKSAILRTKQNKFVSGTSVHSVHLFSLCTHPNIQRQLSTVLGCLFYAYYIFVRLCIPQFHSISMQLFDLRAMVLCVFNSILPGVLVLFLAFFAFLHCWLNAFAEMLRFGDRMFYKDWWNSTSFANYYRTWNVVVHDWLYYYVYRDFLWMTQKRFRAAAMLVVFTVSAVVHEYVLAICFGFFYPVLFCLFMCFGMVFNFVLNDRRKGPIWNVIMWTALFLGQGVLICLYSQEWYAQRFCPIQEPSFIDLLKPRSWTCSP